MADKLKFIKATTFPDKNNPSSVNFHPTEVLVPIEAIACLQKMPHGHYQVRFKTNYPFSLSFPASSVEATLDISKIDLL